MSVSQIRNAWIIFGALLTISGAVNGFGLIAGAQPPQPGGTRLVVTIAALQIIIGISAFQAANRLTERFGWPHVILEIASWIVLVLSVGGIVMILHVIRATNGDSNALRWGIVVGTVLAMFAGGSAISVMCLRLLRKDLNLRSKARKSG